MPRPVLFVCALAAPALGQPAEFTRLPSGFSAINLSADGALVVGQRRDDHSPVLWTRDGGVVPLLLPSGETMDGKAQACSADGSIVVGMMVVHDPITRQVPFRWTASTGLTQLTSERFGFPSSAYAISNDGSVIVGNSGVGGNPPGFVWDARLGVRNLPGPAGEVGGAAMAVSDDGRFAFGSAVSAAEGSFVRWDLQTLQWVFLTLPDNPGFRLVGFVGDCNADGELVVGSADAGPNLQNLPVIWTPDRVRFLGEARGFAFRVSRDGLVVAGGTEMLPSFSARAWIWSLGLGLIDFKTYLHDYHGLSLPDNLFLYKVTGLSDDGRTMTGSASSGVEWLVRLPPARLADFNRDESVDADDLGAFLDCFQGSSLLPPSSADLNRDGITDFFDVIEFLDDFER